jgi:hypothetical protein
MSMRTAFGFIVGGLIAIPVAFVSACYVGVFVIISELISCWCFVTWNIAGRSTPPRAFYLSWEPGLPWKRSENDEWGE